MSIKVLLVEPNKIGGVYYHRQYVPFKNIDLHHKDIQVIRVKPFADFVMFQAENEGVFKELSSFTAIFFTREMPGNAKALVESFNKHWVKVVMDLDDYWSLPSYHLLYTGYKVNDSAKKIVDSLRAANYVTASTKILATEIKKVRLGIDRDTTIVINNAIDPSEDQFMPKGKIEGERVRIGWAGGLCHRVDVNEIRYGVYDTYNDESLKGKFQFVLGGFTLGMKAVVVKNAKLNSERVEERELPMTEQEFFYFERVMSSNFQFVSDYAYGMLTKEGLFKSGKDPMWLNIENRLSEESYRRIWSASSFEYGNIYDEFDVALAPLYNDKFNNCKSSLKIMEAGFKGLPIVVSDVNPYTSFLNEHGKDCAIAIPYHQTKKAWTKSFKKLIESPQMRLDYAARLGEVCKEHYHIDKWASVKADLIRMIHGS